LRAEYRLRAWAVAAAIGLAGQRFGPVQAAGAALVLAAIVGHEVAHLKFKAHGDQTPA
jgi:predicted metal-dependent hydrolase